jgi:hypothetical protein
MPVGPVAVPRDGARWRWAAATVVVWSVGEAAVSVIRREVGMSEKPVGLAEAIQQNRAELEEDTGSFDGPPGCRRGW